MFITSKKIDQLSEEIPGLTAIEMEGAAFSQVAFQEEVDWMVMREFLMRLMKMPLQTLINL